MALIKTKAFQNGIKKHRLIKMASKKTKAFQNGNKKIRLFKMASILTKAFQNGVKKNIGVSKWLKKQRLFKMTSTYKGFSKWHHKI